jgi:hypothetical protein
MDTTALGIGLGLLACTAYTLVRAVRQRTFDLGATLLSFLAGFSVPGGTALIIAAFRGDPATLPSSWREYVAAAGVAAILLGLHYLAQAFRLVWPPRASIQPLEDSPTTQEDR